MQAEHFSCLDAAFRKCCRFFMTFLTMLQRNAELCKQSMGLLWVEENMRRTPRKMFPISKAFQIETTGFKVLQVWIFSSFHFLQHIFFVSKEVLPCKSLLQHLMFSGTRRNKSKESIETPVFISHQCLKAYSKPSGSTPLFTGGQRVYATQPRLLGPVRAKAWISHPILYTSVFHIIGIEQISDN